VVGKQWMWKLQHAEGKKEINELHIPLDRDISLTMTSQDVIHSFFVPAFRVKQDVVPGRYTTEWFHPTRLGEYHLFCAEYCGTNHSRMIGRIVVMEPAEYQQWLTSGESGESIALEGRRLFRDRGCSGCHEGSKTIHAPPLEGVYGKQVPLASGEIVTADDQYLRDSILLPGKQISAGYENIMPSFTGHISEGEIMKIIVYLKTTSQESRAQ
jgi:cytochrome c oxidase subunit II